MSIIHVYNLYDATIETYTAQFFSTHDKLMKRQCESLYEQAKQAHAQNSLSPQGSLYRYSDSYTMVHTADFDDQTGIYTPLQIPVTVCNFGNFATPMESTNTRTSNVTVDEKVYSDLINSNS